MRRQAISGRAVPGIMAFSLAAVLVLIGSGCEQGGSTGDLLGDASSLSDLTATDGLGAGDGLSGLTIEAIDARVNLTEGQIEPMTVALGKFQAARAERKKNRPGCGEGPGRGGHSGPGQGPGHHGGWQNGPPDRGVQGEPPMLVFLTDASDILTRKQFVGLAELITEQREAWRAEHEAAGFGGGRRGPGHGGRGGWGAHGEPDGPGRGHGQEIFEELGLSAQQREQIDAIHQTAREQMQAIREKARSGDLTREQAREQMREAREETRAQVEAVLTPEQLEQLEANRQEHRSERIDRRIERLGQNLDRQIDFMEKVLDLTASQVSQISEILNDSVEARRGILEQVKSGTLEMDEAREQIKGIMEGVADSIAALLTPEQQEVWEALRDLLPRRGNK